MRPTTDSERERRSRSASLAGRARARRARGSSAGCPASVAIEPTVAGGVAGEHDDLDALLEEERDRLPRLGPQLLGEHREPERPQRRRAGIGVVREGAVADPEADDAAAGLLVARAATAASSPSGKSLGRPEHVADAADRLPAPAAAGEERHGLVDAAPPGRGSASAIASSVRFRASEDAA